MDHHSRMDAPQVVVQPAPVNVSVQPPEVRVEAPVVNVQPAEIHVSPEVRVEAPAVNVHVQPAEVAPPAVNITVPPAEVINNVNVAPAVNNVNVAPAEVHVQPAPVNVNVQPAEVPVQVNVEAPSVSVAPQVSCEVHPNVTVPLPSVANTVFVQPATVQPVFNVPMPVVTVNNTVDVPAPVVSVANSIEPPSVTVNNTIEPPKATQEAPCSRAGVPAGPTLNLGTANMLAGCQGVFNFFTVNNLPQASESSGDSASGCPSWAKLLLDRLLGLAWDECTRLFAAQLQQAMAANSRKQFVEVLSQPMHQTILFNALAAHLEASLETADGCRRERWQQSLLRIACSDLRQDLPIATWLLVLGDTHFVNQGFSNAIDVHRTLELPPPECDKMLNWREVTNLATRTALPKAPVDTPLVESTRAYGTTNAMQLLRDIANGEHGSGEATVFEVDKSGEQYRCTDVRVVRAGARHIEVEAEGDRTLSRFPRPGWTVMAACVGHHTAEVRRAAKH